MARYRLGKLQIKRLIEGKPVVDGRGRKYLATEDVKKALRQFDENNLYDRLDAFIVDGGIDFESKAT